MPRAQKKAISVNSVNHIVTLEDDVLSAGPGAKKKRKVVTSAINTTEEEISQQYIQQGGSNPGQDNVHDDVEFDEDYFLHHDPDQSQAPFAEVVGPSIATVPTAVNVDERGPKQKVSIRYHTGKFAVTLLLIQATQSDYIKQFVERINPILQAHLSREALPEMLSRCPACAGSRRASWRCCDCSLARTLCRRCMRHDHRANPLHRIEKWTGTHFQSAGLWEVGCYLVIPHGGMQICKTMEDHMQNMEADEVFRDELEQATLPQETHAHGVYVSTPRQPNEDIGDDAVNEGTPETERATEKDKEQERILDEYIDRVFAGTEENVFEPNDNDPVEEITSNETIPEYLWSRPNHTASRPAMKNRKTSWHDDRSVIFDDPATASYVRVIHTTGIHHIGMVSCSCEGVDLLPTDLVASNFLPSSFKRIRTLFSAHVLDQSRQCNLEMKSSAYQFYNYLRRSTDPMNPSGVLNVLHEFRRMTRLWRWMKKLKWAGYGHNHRNPMDATNGELANFCPACPQDGKNIPDDWQKRADAFLYRIQLAADGNFKADHVRCYRAGQDVWLIDGGGMAPNRKEYTTFLSKHHNIPTVSEQYILHIYNVIKYFYRRRPVKIDFMSSKWRYNHRRTVMFPAKLGLLVPVTAVFVQVASLIYSKVNSRKTLISHF